MFSNNLSIIDFCCSKTALKYHSLRYSLNLNKPFGFYFRLPRHYFLIFYEYIYIYIYIMYTSYMWQNYSLNIIKH